MLINMPEGQWSTMNFTPFTGPFTGSIPVHQFTAKFANASGQTTAVPPGTVVVSGGDGGIHYLRPHELVSQGTTLSNQTLITVPVNVGKYARLAEVQTTQTSQSQQQQSAGGTTTVQAQGLQQTATVQVLNHGGIKYNVTPVSMQQFSQMTAPVGATVLTVAYPADLDGSGDGKQQTQCFPVEIQAQDLCATLVVAAPSVSTSENEKGTQIKEVIIKREDGNDKEDRTAVTTAGTSEIDFQGQTVTTAMPATWQSLATPGSTVADYLARLPASTLPLSLHHFLKFSAESIKKENSEACTVTLPPAHQPIVVTTAVEPEPEVTEAVPEEEGEGVAGTTKTKKKKKGKKAVKQPRMRPGQVQLTTALDGTTLFCCPECHMAYPDKDLLEQHLVAHKIERRFICDICGAGLKRKEHLDRHKQGHNPERPFICSVCMKGFKRKEHLNLHFVIHSGEKTHVCPECGKGFYRKDHLRKHSRSHLAKRVKNEMNDQIKITNILQQVSAEATSSEDPLKLIP